MLRSAVVLGLLASAVAVRAQPAAAPDAQPTAAQAEAQAEALFRQGRNLKAAGKLAEACDALEESNKLAPAITTLLNLAGCREKLGQLATAWGLFLDAERQTRSARDAATRELHSVARSHASKLDGRISRLTIAVPPARRVAGLEITRGSERIDAAAWNRALPLDGGSYTITARIPGKQPWSTQVTVGKERDARTVEIPDLRNAPDAAPPPSPPPPPSGAATAAPAGPASAAGALAGTTDGTAAASPARPAPEQPPSRLLPISLGVGALALFGGALGFDHWAYSLYRDARAEVTSQSRRDDLYASANARRYVAGGFVAGGIVCAAASAWLFLRGGAERAPTAAHRLVVSPTGIAVVGAF